MLRNLSFLLVLSECHFAAKTVGHKFNDLTDCLQDVTEVVNTCHEAGISKKCVKLRPIAVIKG